MNPKVTIEGVIHPNMELFDAMYVPSHLGVAKEFALSHPFTYYFPILPIPIAQEILVVSAENASHEQKIVAAKMECDFFRVDFASWGPHNGFEIYVAYE